MKTQNEKIVAVNKTINPLTIEDLRKAVPSAFQTKPHSSMSDKYQFISTVDIINQLIEAGFVAFQANQWNYREKSKVRAYIGYQPHAISFYHPDFVIVNGKNQIEEYFQITVKNSHNGFSKLSIMSGFYRLVCDNGMLAMSENLGHVVTKHMGKDLKLNTVELIQEITEQFNFMASSVRKMKSIRLTKEKQIGLAKRMIKIRESIFNPSSKTKYPAEELLKPLRESDKGNSLWKTYNVIQEKLIKGYDFNTPKTAREDDSKSPRKLRAVKHFSSQINFNKKMFEAATELV